MVPMTVYKRIFIFYPAAIGDTVLSTPVPVTLKQKYPGAHVMYQTHTSLIPLLSMCKAIDEVVPYEKKMPVAELRGRVLGSRPDLFVDLTRSVRARLLTAFTGIPVLRYKKQNMDEMPRKHAAENLLDTLAPLGIERSDKLFPTLSPDAVLLSEARSLVSIGENERFIVMVPGVGGLRPHRAWDEAHWIELGRKLEKDMTVVLVGGAHEQALCARIQERLGRACLNAAGRLSLPQTAALLSQAIGVVSGDTGPSHIAVAVGTPVVGVLGPTYVERSGPYGMKPYCVDVSANCKCQKLKHCQLLEESFYGAGWCMAQVETDQVLSKVEALLATAR
jgi:heptosyltransferase I